MMIKGSLVAVVSPMKADGTLAKISTKWFTKDITK